LNSPLAKREIAAKNPTEQKSNFVQSRETAMDRISTLSTCIQKHARIY
jgi:hypothetical protein